MWGLLSPVYTHTKPILVAFIHDEFCPWRLGKCEYQFWLTFYDLRIVTHFKKKWHLKTNMFWNRYFEGIIWNSRPNHHLINNGCFIMTKLHAHVHIHIWIQAYMYTYDSYIYLEHQYKCAYIYIYIYTHTYIFDISQLVEGAAHSPHLGCPNWLIDS